MSISQIGLCPTLMTLGSVGYNVGCSEVSSAQLCSSLQVCTKCKIEKDASQFHRNTLTASGLVSRCKQCIAETDARRCAASGLGSGSGSGLGYGHRVRMATRHPAQHSS